VTADARSGDGGQWVLLAYRLPREPSTPRIALWRKLKRLGVVQIGDGLVGLPLDSRTREALEWIAEEVLEADGEAAIWLAASPSRRQERELAARMAGAIAAEYEAVAQAAHAAAGEALPVRRRTLARLRRELQRIRRRDFFPPPERREAEEAVEGLARALEVAA
jgi:Protein ChrB, N-terminal